MTRTWGGPFRAATAVALLVLVHLHAQDKGPVLFVGSSIFHRWTQLASQMAPLAVNNIAFDGADTDDWNRLIDSRVLPLRPKVIVYYCGSNDVDAGDTPVRIFARIREFKNRVTTALPQAQVVFVSVNKAPEKHDRWDVIDEINRRVEQYAAKNPQVLFVDVNPALFNADGTSRTDLFMNDQLHLRPPAYEEFAKILKPVLERLSSRPVEGRATFGGRSF